LKGRARKALATRSPALRIAAAFALMAMPLLAAEGGGDDPKMEPWKIANFVILCVVLGWLIAKNLGPFLVARTKGIQEGLAAGERAQKEAAERAAAVEAKLATLGEAIAEMKAAAHQELDIEAERIRRSTQAELARVAEHAAQEIESAGKLARVEVQRAAARMAIELAEQKVRARMSPETQAVLLGNFVGEIASLPDGADHRG